MKIISALCPNKTGGPKDPSGVNTQCVLLLLIELYMMLTVNVSVFNIFHFLNEKLMQNKKKKNNNFHP